MIKAGDKVTIRPEWQDAGDSAFEWRAVDNEEQGRVTIEPQGTGLPYPPRQVVNVDMLEQPARYAVEFPDFPATDLPAIPATWTDESWRNDACPSWRTAFGYRVFVDYADPAARENGGARFTVLDSEDGHVLDSDEWRDVLALEYVMVIGYDPFADDPNATESEVAQTLAEHADAARAESTIINMARAYAENPDISNPPSPEQMAALLRIIERERK